MKKFIYIFLLFCLSVNVCRAEMKRIPEIKWDSKSLIIDNHRVMPVMGEVHYSRIPKEGWKGEVKKIKEGGVSILAVYVFWNHIEEKEGIFDWSGQRNLRDFLKICKEENLPVLLRIGPFCHGEARNGGIPDWMYKKRCKIREENDTFLQYTARLYRQIFSQVQGLLWKDGGPVMAAQFDNEYGGKGSYILKLKEMALQIGFDLPFYTRTGWPELQTPIPYGEMIPMYGDYADGFWDRSLDEGTGEYYKAFNFKNFRTPTAIASEQLTNQSGKDAEDAKAYPYFTCELGGGMMCSYHRRPYIYPEDAYSMAIVKLGSGSNLLGYYMYHGGTNPDGYLNSLNETQRNPGINYNDLPVKTYDFQAPIGEFGQLNPHYYLLRKVHLFMEDYGETLAPMEPCFPESQERLQGDDNSLRWSYRCQGDSGFVFVNNYERLCKLSPKKGVRFNIGSVSFPSKPITVPSGTTCIFPVNIDGIRYATAQLIAHRDGKIYLEQIKGIPTEINVNGKILRNLKPLGVTRPVYGNIYLIDSETAGRLFLNEKNVIQNPIPVKFTKIKESAHPHIIKTGAQNVAEQPYDSDFENAAIYRIEIPENRDKLLIDINYRGDVARLYINGKLVEDNFYNGRTMQYGLWRIPKGCRQMELYILPLQENMPVYFPREANYKKSGEELISVTLI